MNRIERISKLCNCGVFRDFNWPGDLPEFGRYNLIYGWNGSGKTTLSRLFRDLEHQRVPKLGDAVLQVGGNAVHSDDFADTDCQIRVFNREFIEENVFRFDGKDIPPVFVLGVENVEKQREIDSLVLQLSAAQSAQDSLRSAKETAVREYDQFCRVQARAIKESLRSNDQNPFNNYNKADFEADAEQMVDIEPPPMVLSDREHQKLRDQLHPMRKENLSKLIYSFPDFDEIVVVLSELMQKTVVSTAIEKLKADIALSSWIQKGLRLHRERDVEWCGFCEQKMPHDRMAALEAHFSTEYERITRRIDQEKKKLEYLADQTESVTHPNIAALYDDLREEYQAASEELDASLKLARDFFSASAKGLEEKIGRIFEQREFKVEAPSVDVASIEKLNSVIDQHNEACDKLEERVAKARKRLASNTIASELEEFKILRHARKQVEEDLQANQRVVQNLKNGIANLEREIVEHRRPAEDLNDDLHKYLGHTELSLEIKEAGYELRRGDYPAEFLSEGETTAIALLYFLKSLKDRSFEPTNGVIVLDDPVSSLDANALFLAFGFIRDRTQDAGQLFVLTHNFTLFRQIRNWFHYLSRARGMNASLRSTRFYMINSVIRNGMRNSVIDPLDPLLEQFESEYQFLFSRVYLAQKKSELQTLEQNYFLPNIARRLLESFLAFRRPNTTGDLWHKLNTVSFDHAKKLRILRFLHTHSHSDAVGEQEQDVTLLAESPAVLKDLLELMQQLDPDHYCSMSQLVSPQDTKEEKT